LTDPLLAGRSIPVSSCTLGRLDNLCPDLPGGVLTVAGPRLDPRPVARFGGGDATRITGASILAARRCAPDAVREIFFGIAGTGGASAALGTARAGEGSLKVRSLIDPLLPLRSSIAPGGPFMDPATELPMDEVEPARRSILLVCTSPTDIGVVGRDRRAAAAAADESDALEAWFLRKAEAAAVAADGLGLEIFGGCT
jgi:hypothetical protein